MVNDDKPNGKPNSLNVQALFEAAKAAVANDLRASRLARRERIAKLHASQP